MEPTTSAVLLGPPAKKLVESVVADLYILAKAEGIARIQNWRAATRVDTIHKKLRQLRLVKTILQSEKAVDLSTFYHPARILITAKKSKQINQLKDIPFDGSLVVEGTVGQGKSIFLRYLAMAEFAATRRIPVFVELRRLGSNRSLVSAALDELKALGIEMNEEAFTLFVSRGRLLLLLDAFDEVKEEQRQHLLDEIEMLIRTHDELRVVVTSRPASGVQESTLLRVFKLSPIDSQHHAQVISRMAQDADTASQIINGIKRDGLQIVHLLTTPLMIALLIVRYRIDQSIPQNSAAFYESLFSLLLQRHDKMKGGYVRPRKSKLSDNDILDCFNALAFITRKAGENSFTPRQLNKQAREAISITGHQANPESVIADVIEITCLMIADGAECRFIHKSVQEYHAALFVREQPDEAAVSFYRAVSSREKWAAWSQELTFLSEIDRYRYLKHFYIPQVDSTFRAIGLDVNDSNVSLESTRKLCGLDCIRFGGRGGMVGVSGTGQHWCTFEAIHTSGYLDVLFQQCRKLGDGSAARSTDVAGETEVSVEQMLERPDLKGAIQAACTRLCVTLLKDRKEALAYIEQMEQRRDILAL